MNPSTLMRTARVSGVCSGVTLRQLAQGARYGPGAKNRRGGLRQFGGERVAAAVYG